MMNRRDLLKGILAAGVAPMFVRAEILMPVKKIIVPEWPTSILATTTSTSDVITLDTIRRFRQYIEEQQDIAFHQEYYGILPGTKRVIKL